MDITIDENEPEDSISRYVMDTTCIGEDTVSVPPHWHKVSGCSPRETLCYKIGAEYDLFS